MFLSHIHPRMPNVLFPKNKSHGQIKECRLCSDVATIVFEVHLLEHFITSWFLPSSTQAPLRRRCSSHRSLDFLHGLFTSLLIPEAQAPPQSLLYYCNLLILDTELSSDLLLCASSPSRYILMHPLVHTVYRDERYELHDQCCGIKATPINEQHDFLSPPKNFMQLVRRL